MFYFVALLLLIALVLGVWLLVLDKDSPFNKRHAQNDALATPVPTATVELTDAPTDAPVETTAPVSTDAPAAQPTGEATAEPTATPEPLPTPTATPQPTVKPTSPYQLPGTRAPEGVTAQPTDAPTAEPTLAPTAEPVAEPTAKPASRYQLPPTAPPLDQQGLSPDEIDGTAALYGSGDATGDDGQSVENASPEVTPEPTPAPRMARVTLSSKDGKLNLRAQPNTTSSILAELPDGTLVTVLGDEGNWKQVSVNDLVGYLREDYLREVEPETAAAPTDIGSAATVSAVTLDLPYYIEVDRGMQVVRVYTMGEDGTYSLLAREMICSTDSFNRKPPNGTYVLDGEKLRWLTTFTPNSYAQYATRITGHILFHSIPYGALTSDSLNAEAYAALGTNASIGCVRLLCTDAKWIYDNVPAGTVVKYVTSPRDEDKLAELAAPALVSGNWDPTDPADGNPDYNPDYAAAHPVATPVPGVTPAPTAPWTPDTYA